MPEGSGRTPAAVHPVQGGMHVVATAGHVDHGKSTLVRALTGMEPDRYAEERRRGMTLDLGFAWTTLAPGVDVAFVDVPGHARFVPTMLAGVGPVPAVLFVVAADEGWRQQSAEHLAVLDAFEVRHAVLAVTRSDLADPTAATTEALARLAGSSLQDVTPVAVSGVTGAGLPALRAALARMAARLPPPDRAAPVRLWVDRVFPVTGAGTVVTGTLGAGTLRVGTELQVQPGGHRVRVRGLETLKRRVEEVGPVARVAVNLRGVPHSALRRGSALLAPGAWLEPAVLDVRLSLPAGELPAEARVHVGSAAVPARVRPLAGQAGDDRARLARLSLAAALPLRLGDRLVVRDPSRHDRLAGAEVLDVAPPPLRRRGAAAARADALRSARGLPDVAAEVARRGAVRRAELLAMGVPAGDVPSPVAGTTEGRAAGVAGDPGAGTTGAGAAGVTGDPLAGTTGRPGRGIVAVGEWLVDPGVWQRWTWAVAAVVAEAAKRSPQDPAPSRAAVVHAAQLPDPGLLDALLAPAGLVSAAGRVRLRAPDAPVPAGAPTALDALLQRLEADPFAAPEAPELAAAGLGRPVLAAAARAGQLVAVGAATSGIWLRPGWMEVAVRRLAELPQPFTLSQARQALGTTRRVAVPVLEALDAARRTRRLDGSHRVVVGVR